MDLVLSSTPSADTDYIWLLPKSLIESVLSYCLEVGGARNWALGFMAILYYMIRLLFVIYPGVLEFVYSLVLDLTPPAAGFSPKRDRVGLLVNFSFVDDSFILKYFTLNFRSKILLYDG